MKDAKTVIGTGDAMNSFNKLKVWSVSHELVLAIYKVTSGFPDREKFRLTDQLCRSAASVPANIVEGNSRGHLKEYLQFINTAYASLEEMRYHLLLARDLGYLSSGQHQRLEDKAVEINKMLNSLKKYLKSKILNLKSK